MLQGLKNLSVMAIDKNLSFALKFSATRKDSWEKILRELVELELNYGRYIRNE